MICIDIQLDATEEVFNVDKMYGKEGKKVMELQHGEAR